MAENITIFPTGLTYSRNTKAPLMDMQVFDTLALAQAYVDNKDQTAYVGLTVSVTKDGSNNGLYYVERIADADNATGLLVKVGSDSAADVAEVKADVANLKTTVGDETSGLVADVAVNTAAIAANVENIAKKADVFTVGNGLSYSENKINVVVSTAEGNSLSVDENGLYVAVPTITVPEYTLESVESPAETYASQYEFKKDGVVLNTINIPKDQFLKSADYNAETNNLIFVFSTFVDGAYTDKTVNVDVNDLVDTYTAGDYITITSSEISVDYEALRDQLNSELGLSQMSEDIVNMEADIAALQQTVDAETTGLSAVVASHTTKIDDHDTRIATLEGVQHPTLEQVTTLETNYTTLNNTVTNLATEVKVKDVDTTASNGVSLKLANDGKVGVTVDINTIASAVISQHTIDTNAIAIAANIGTEKNPDRYTTSDNVQGVLASMNERIESIDADIQSALEGGVTGIEAGNGITVDSTTATKPVVGVKVASGSAIKVNANGLDLLWEELA